MEGQQSGERSSERTEERTAERSSEEKPSEGVSERPREGSGGMVRGHTAIMKDAEDLDSGPPGSHGVSFGETIRGLAAQGHGIGEAFRGNLGAAVDSMLGDAESQAKYEEIARRGRYEIREKKFAPKEEENER